MNDGPEAQGLRVLLATLAGAPAASLLLAAIGVFGVLGLTRWPGLVDRWVLRPHGLAQRGDWHTLVSCGFVHADLMHLLFNAFTLWAFGFGLEQQLGTPRFVALYTAGLLVSSLATWWLHRKQPGYASLGASGAILAVLFAAILVSPGSSLYIVPIPVPIPAPLFALGYLAFSVFGSRTQLGRVNHDAHIAGAVTGVLFIAAVQPALIGAALRSWLG
jgi:membrane associated rhomboid family serine protease